LDESEDGKKDEMILKGRKQKMDKQMRILENTTLDDILMDNKKTIQAVQQFSDTTYLQFIKGCNPKTLSQNILKKICIMHQISGCKNKLKTLLLYSLIVE
jgi:hypothetical protein